MFPENWDGDIWEDPNHNLSVEDELDDPDSTATSDSSNSCHQMNLQYPLLLKLSHLLEPKEAT